MTAFFWWRWNRNFVFQIWRTFALFIHLSSNSCIIQDRIYNSKIVTGVENLSSELDRSCYECCRFHWNVADHQRVVLGVELSTLWLNQRTKTKLTAIHVIIDSDEQKQLQYFCSSMKWPNIVGYVQYRITGYINNKLQYNRYSVVNRAD